MAEASIFGLASRILWTIHDSKSLKAAFERAAGSTLRLQVLKEAVEAVKPYLLDAEKREESSVEIKSWIKAVREALYNADDLLEEVLANDSKAGGGGGRRRRRRRMQQFLNKVALSSSPIFIDTDIMRQLVKASRKIGEFGLKEQDEEEPNQLRPTYNNVGRREGNISIRVEDKDAILGYLRDDVSLVIIVGMGGMGKTTIAQLVCKNEEVQEKYKTVWWASMSDSFDEEEIYQRILESMIGKSSSGNLTLPLLKAKVRGCMFSAKSFLLVLDDIWAQDFDRFMRIRPLVKIVPKGSTIIVTSKRIVDSSPIDGIAVGSRRLDKLSVDDSKKLLGWFPENGSVGAGDTMLIEPVLAVNGTTPLAIKFLSSLFYGNPGGSHSTTDDLSKINASVHPQRAPLMFSYEQLKSDLKDCFAYCSLFPDNYVIHRRELVSLWVAQGYVRSEEEVIGDSYFMQLLGMSFLHDPKKDDLGGIYCCKIHDLVRDVARQVAGEESITLMKDKEQQGRRRRRYRRRREELNQGSRRRRHCAVGYEIDNSWEFPWELFREVDQLRSILFMGGGGTLNPDLFAKMLAKFKRLRALSLENLNLKEVPSSIGELYMLRYLNLSHNSFKHLPGSITNLFNLLTLDITGCSELREWPKGFSRLVNLRRLHNSECHSLRHMPPGIGEMIALEELGCFKVRKRVECSRIDGLRKLLKLSKLRIRFDHEWKQEPAPLDSLPETLKVLHIECYRGTNLPFFQSKLVELHLYNCTSVKDLSSLACLKCLENLVLFWMDDLEQVVIRDCPASSIFSVLSKLVKLVLRGLPRFVGWPRSVNEDCGFTRLSFLKVEDCPQLEYMPPSTTLKTLSLRAADASLIHELLSSSSSLEDVTVDDCDGLSCFNGGELTSLSRLKLSNCTSLKGVHLPRPSPNLVMEKTLRNCPYHLIKEGEDDKMASSAET